jgi:hypothetical protein
MKSLLLLVLVLVSCGVLAQTDSFKAKQSRRNLQSAAMRIFVDYEAADTQWKADALVDKYVFAKKLMKKTVDFYTVFLKVKYPKDTYTIPDVPGDGFTVKAKTMSYDLHTYFKVYNKNDNGFAAAAPLHKDAETGRTLVGYFELNLNAISPSKANMINHFGTFVHEFYHILVFNNELYEHFINADKTKIGRANLITESITLGGKARMGYKGTSVLTFAKSHLNDQSITNIIMENDGGSGSAGSHWEHMYFPTDFMSPIDTTPSLHSELSFSMAVDSGWFEVDVTKTEQLEYGKNAGANFMSGSCPTANSAGFCAAADLGKSFCPPDSRYKAKCYTDSTYSENCHFLFADIICSVDDSTYTADKYDSSFETLGADSKCAMVKKAGTESSATAYCAKASCDNANVLTYTFKNSLTCACSAANQGQEVSCGSGSSKIVCPTSAQITDICTRLQTANKCPDDCSGNGLCLGKVGGSRTCFCLYGFKGTNCAESNPEETDAKIKTWATSTNTNKSNLMAAATLFAAYFVMMMLA